jgi:hypothetical protein
MADGRLGRTLVEKAEAGEVRAVKVLEEERLPVEREDGDVFTAADDRSSELESAKCHLTGRARRRGVDVGRV